MFHLFGCCGKKSVTVLSYRRNVDLVADKSKKTPSSLSSVSVADTLAANICHEKVFWLHRLFGQPHHNHQKEKTRVITLDVKTGEPKKKSTKPCWWRKKTNRVTPCPEEPAPEKQRPPAPHQDTVVELKDGKERPPEVKKVLPSRKDAQDIISIPKTLRHQQFKCLGFPNPAQNCYMNSCLQSLLTLQDFVASISCQEPVWSSTPDAAIMRSFMDISRSHLLSDVRQKAHLLLKFKTVVAALNPEFADYHQKDAHEFLTSVLYQMMSLSTQLRMKAASMGRTYSCAVEDHMVFKMQSIRTCKRCGAGSTRQEEYTNLSLDLLPGRGTIQQMLENYLKEEELEYKCECGATVSGNCMSFVNLPRVLVLHLKRFRFTPAFQLKKVNDPVHLSRDLVLSSSKGGACYRLVSSISHLSLRAQSGHYISDSVDLDVGQEDLNDRWFTYNDAVVTETTGDSVCAKRQRSSYILFYRRQD